MTWGVARQAGTTYSHEAAAWYGHSALAPSAHGGRPPGGSPGHRPVPALRRHVPPGSPPRGGAILPSATILKPGKITRMPTRRLRCHSGRDRPVRAVDPRRHADNRAQKGLVGMRTAIRSLEGAKASPKPAAGRYAPPRTCQGSLRDPCGQTLDRTSPAQIPAAIGFGGGVVRRQNHVRPRSHRRSRPARHRGRQDQTRGRAARCTLLSYQGSGRSS